MKVLDVITTALTLIGRHNLVDFVTDPSNALDEDAGEVIETLLYCFNAVEDELARKYIPLVAEEQMCSADMRFFYSGFQHFPLKIKRVSADGKYIPFKVLAKYLETGAEKVTVEYEYAPSRKTMEDSSDYESEVGEHLIALGIASEYCIINGEAEMADRWEKKYRDKLDEVQRKLPVCASIPPRRWV